MDETNERRRMPNAAGVAGDFHPGGEHVDEVTAMRLADGAAVPEGAAAHAAGCRRCAALVAALRAEAQSLFAALALDADEVAFMLGAALPALTPRMVEREAARVAREQRRNVVLFGMAVVALLVVYALWLVVSATLGSGLDLARRAGLTAAVARAVAGGSITVAQSLWNAVDLAVRAPLLDAPALPLLAVAGAMWLALCVAGTVQNRRGAEPARLTPV
jgi:hypothetical protein